MKIYKKPTKKKRLAQLESRNELVIALDPKEFIAQTDPMMRENDEEVFMVSKLSSEGKMETTFTLMTK